MNREQYIIDELAIMRSECRKQGISAQEWIQRNAAQYSERHLRRLRIADKNIELRFWFLGRFFWVLTHFARKILQPFKVNRIQKDV